MQFYTFVSILVCASALAQAAPLWDSPDVSTQSLATINEVEKGPDHNPSTVTKDLAKRSTISMFSKLTKDAVLNLASGALLSVTKITFSGSVPAPAIDGTIATTLNSIGIFLGTNPLQTVGATSLSTNSVGVLHLTWSTPSAQVPNFTSLEWQTVLTAMYRALAAQSSLGDFIEVAFDVGGITLDLALGLL